MPNCFLSILSLLFLVPFLSQAQKNDFYLGAKAGLWAVRGETSSDEFNAIELGSNIGIAHGLPLKDTRFELNTEFDFGVAEVHREIRVVNASRSQYKANIQQAAFSVGFRAYLNAPSTRTHNPPHLLNIYGTVFTGMLLNTVKSNYDVLGENKFNYLGGTHMAAFMGVETGLLLNLPHPYTLGLFLNIRHGFNDYWDGLKGSSGSDDYVVRTGLSWSYHL